ncbi:hypothetical protein BC938DRAFT_476248 [Jimgerdemannia flammicorona]|uniref:MTHFR SAM-binding regulatory domain-containing protein n=1 Tax=Jimgerdemannia flammicorona TaxID=994334 RepID=A0A433QQQ3_9FUNG|nr:hypothetical protein BC938DRAFT_476248 [Jimgerdemannia flammicorona]
MKVIDKIHKAEEEGRNFWSFEYFPPKTQQFREHSFEKLVRRRCGGAIAISVVALKKIGSGPSPGVQNLYDRIERMYRLGPEFVDITWNAGGVTSQLSVEIVATAQSVYGLETMMHLTCTNMPKEKIDVALKYRVVAWPQDEICGLIAACYVNRKPRIAGAKISLPSVVTPRGVLPTGRLWKTASPTQSIWSSTSANSTATTLELPSPASILNTISSSHALTGHPEGHVDNRNLDEDIQFLKQKVDAGADLIVTQLFYDIDIFLEYVRKCRAAGITVPILPGIFPIQSYNGLKRVISFDNNVIPQKIWDDLEPIKDDDAAVKEYGIKLAIEHIQIMMDNGINGFHFYTFNLERSTRLILEGLGFVPAPENVKPLPWNPSLSKKRAKENVRPIFWKNRIKSYIQRTESWDEFPNGRWGDSRSPAFGELDGYGITLKYTPAECLAMWGTPATSDDISLLFAKFCRGEVAALPWSAQQLDPETDAIRQRLAAINLLGYLTINSQPAVNGTKSADKLHGWGPKNGYVYQKAYLEFFVSPDKLDELIRKIERDPEVTYYAVNKQGDLRTNTKTDGPNAVTWGVFPGKEIIQPTVVEAVSFMAWKEEAFELWAEWARIYPAADSVSAQLIKGIENSYYLINIVHNDFQDDHAIWRMFDLEIDGAISRKLREHSIGAL